MRQAAAEDGRQDRAILFYLLDKRIERIAEFLLYRLVPHAWSSNSSNKAIKLLSSAIHSLHLSSERSESCCVMCARGQARRTAHHKHRGLPERSRLGSDS